MASIKKSFWIALLPTLFLAFQPLSSLAGEPVPIGTWKTAQTIQPFFYNRFLPDAMQSQVFAFTNPADQKTALLAGSLAMCGTTLAHARATRFLIDHSEKWLQRAAAFGTPIDVLQAAAPNMALAWDMNDTFIRQAGALGTRMQALGIIARPPDYDRLFDRSFVQQTRTQLK